MKNKLSLLVLFVLTFGLFPVGSFAADSEHYIEIIFDGSGSMNEVLNSEVKIDIARNAIDETLGKIDGASNVGLRVYGLEEDDCKSSELVVDFAQGNKGEIVDVVNGVTPTGSTPIGYSVARAREDLEHKPGVRKIIVIGDGQETCGADMEMEGKRLKGLGVDLDAIFLGEGARDAEDLKALAGAAGGDFYQASSSQGLKDALNNALDFPDFDLPPMDDMEASGDFGFGGIEINETVLEEEVAESFEEACQIPPQLGDQVLYDEYLIEDVVDAPANISTGLEVVLDVSGSMAGQVDGRAKLDIAREALGSALEDLSDDVDLALRVYGHRIDKTDQENSCKDIELLVPFYGDNFEIASKNNDMRVQNVIDKAKALSPRGWTPIGASLEQAAENLKNFDNKVVLLLSDGEETCGGDPVGKMKALEAQGVQITVHTVGFDVDAATAEQLRQISEATGGKYVDAGSATELTEGLSHIVEEADKESAGCPPLFQNPIKGGDSFENSVVIEPGTYTFEGFLEIDEWYHFKMPVEQGDVVRLYGLAAMPRVLGNHEDGFYEEYSGSRSTFTIEPYVDLDAEDMVDLRFREQNSKNLLKHRQVRLTKAADVGESEIEILEDGVLYLRVGNQFFQTHKDNIFSIQMKDAVSPVVADDSSMSRDSDSDLLDDEDSERGEGVARGSEVTERVSRSKSSSAVDTVKSSKSGGFNFMWLWVALGLLLIGGGVVLLRKKD